ncbi:MAG: sigma-70 family RNA polymerase sigma factor [Bacillota bacterium]|nr:sigma-70 family RNA polymerase sigma factor [Bacillota bacterium]
MTNEELAIMAAQGDTESLHKLYFAVAPLIYKITSRYFKYCKNNRKGLRPEDLVQCGYFAYLEALKQYSPEKELKFTSYLNFCVAGECWKELGIYFKTGGKVLNREVKTISLEAPISNNDENFALQDIISDPDADVYDYCELNEMRIIVRREIERLPSKEQQLIYAVFYENKTKEEIGMEFGWDYDFTRKIRHHAYRCLRRSKVMQELRRAYAWRSKDTFPEYLNLADFDDLFNDSGLKPI